SGHHAQIERWRRQQALRRQQLAERLKPHRREREALESRLEALQAELTALHDRLAAATDKDDIAEAGRRLKAVQLELARVEERWMAVAETIEALEREAAQADADAAAA
ncbi:MAG: ABC transporter C-terminal domain-containing protein, partial [Tepidimonas sp.]|uniref:ABC transporter C-terminal domain-containing protein n=1 Tax=Tepidimonas sp. TaxID=2002775 RepID=UPI004054E4A6